MGAQNTGLPYDAHSRETSGCDSGSAETPPNSRIALRQHRRRPPLTMAFEHSHSSHTLSQCPRRPRRTTTAAVHTEGINSSFKTPV
ncbi:hypothetical protein HPB50_015923 [Hyalomma asiaticum]|uniref:Uncharacterized protein n=1 Tax=Hyalomma asiaticum TaxID=266040 RepID=A0ACB7RUE2_HYAAI|nr:hypothetical protein HPB50_015923 [Hyalomma asiaticum]